MADDTTTKININSTGGSQNPTPPISFTPPVQTTSTNPTPAGSATAEPAEDMFDDVKKDIRKRFELLPEEIQQAIMDDNYQMQLFEIAKANKITYEQLSYLEMQTTMVLLGMLPPDEYRDELQVALKKNDPEIDVIVREVNEKVFAPIRASIQKIYAVQNTAEQYVPDSIVTASAQPKKVIMPIIEQVQMPKTAPVAPMPSTISVGEKGILEKSGVTLSETPAPVTPSSTPLPSRNDMLAGIENPTRIPRPNIVAEKLASAGPVIASNKTTDYSLPKTTAPSTTGVPTPPSRDPYRESTN